MIVVDASVLAPALVDAGESGERARERIGPEVLLAPELLDLEVTSVLRRSVRGGGLSAERAGVALQDLIDLPITRTTHRPLLGRCWELRDNLTSYDAAYVALAELYGVALVTADRRLATAPGIRCRVEVLA